MQNKSTLNEVNTRYGRLNIYYPNYFQMMKQKKLSP